MGLRSDTTNPFSFGRSCLKKNLFLLGLFCLPIGTVVIAHLIRPPHVVHVDMDQLMKKYAVHISKTQEGAFSASESLQYARAFKACVEGVAEKNRWIVTDVRRCWGAPSVIGSVKDATSVVESVCCGGAL